MSGLNWYREGECIAINIASRFVYVPIQYILQLVNIIAGEKVFINEFGLLTYSKNIWYNDDNLHVQYISYPHIYDTNPFLQRITEDGLEATILNIIQGLKCRCVKL